MKSSKLVVNGVQGCRHFTVELCTYIVYIYILGQLRTEGPVIIMA